MEEYNIICETYKYDLDAFSLQAQLKLLPEFVKGSNLSLSELINCFRTLPATKQSILAEAFKLMKLILVAPATNAISERSFSALKHLKTKMRSAMHNNRLNQLTKLTRLISVRQPTSLFRGKISERSDLAYYKFCKFMINFL